MRTAVDAVAICKLRPQLSTLMLFSITLSYRWDGKRCYQSGGCRRKASYTANSVSSQTSGVSGSSCGRCSHMESSPGMSTLITRLVDIYSNKTYMYMLTPTLANEVTCMVKSFSVHTNLKTWPLGNSHQNLPYKPTELRKPSDSYYPVVQVDLSSSPSQSFRSQLKKKLIY